MHKKPIEEHEIRSALLRFLSETTPDGERIHEEFRIERGSSRVDVAVIGAGLAGYEIKSDRDSFGRFSNQIHAYNRVFDRIHLVCGPSHAGLAEGVVPSWWGLVVAHRNEDGGIELNIRRHANKNPKQDAFSLASLLWREEALAVLSTKATAVPQRASSHVLWEYIATSLPVEAIRNAVAETLLKRRGYNDLAVKTM